MSRQLQEFYRYPEGLLAPSTAALLSDAPNGFFRFGAGAIGYGQASQATAPRIGRDVHTLPDLLPQAVWSDGGLRLPFDPDAVIENLQYERYLEEQVRGSSAVYSSKPVKAVYNLIRPILGPLRSHLQKAYFRGWDQIPFPRWPLDTSVEQLRETILERTMRGGGIEEIPFIWFWPDGANGAAMFTHDVEAQPGLDFIPGLMDEDDAFGVKASFQIVPEERYKISDAELREIRRRGFEVNVHGLTHRGNLFEDRETFLADAEHIRRYAQEFESTGFRSPCMYRNIDWMGDLGVSYDMSVPNVAHLEPQRGGCCTIFPYFAGDVLELPLTTIQDYSLFQILGDYSIELWKTQIGLILEKHGLVSFIVHPDYMLEDRARAVYRQLLAYVRGISAERGIWVALPGEIHTWWRQRSKMKLVAAEGGWRIEGPGSPRARIAFAHREDDRIVYSVGDSAVSSEGARKERR